MIIANSYMGLFLFETNINFIITDIRLLATHDDSIFI